MNTKIQKLLSGQGSNYLLPFFWQHGEDEATLREYMKAIQEAGIGAVCVESRPHPDYCGPKWWQDMDVILDEARTRGMQVWILDDSHFPTGFANGAVDKEPDALCRQSVLHKVWDVKAGETFDLPEEDQRKAPERIPTAIEARGAGDKNPRHFEDDRLLGFYSIKPGGSREKLTLPYTAQAEEKVYGLWLSRNYGYHTHYINMCQKESVRILIDAVYEPHWEHYKEDFGKTIAGFFSDEPELGNGHLYAQTGFIGNPDMDYPWSEEIEALMKEKLGERFPADLYLLFEEGGEAETAEIRYVYMDILTGLVKQDFSYQLGDWCRAHGVQYIGHLIEDNDMHCKTGSSLGHFFRGLAGEDWDGIDDIGGQVFPQGEDISYNVNEFYRRDGQFYHYMLGKLGSSAAAIEPLKNGNSMCEIFGAYGWGEGVRLEKYLVDHFMVRGINHFVPHAFSAKDFPDPDCPPHFYAHGHNPQYRHFGALMRYTNRVLELINGGRHVAKAAVLYHGDASWSGQAMTSHTVGRVLADNQIEFDYIPQDVFASPKEYKTEIANGTLRVNTQEYKALIIPECEYIRKELAEAIPKLRGQGIEVCFVNAFPKGTVGGEADLEMVKNSARLVSAEETASIEGTREITIQPANNRLRYLHYEQEDGSGVYMFVNEGTETYHGNVSLRDTRYACRYNAWNNVLEPVSYDGQTLTLDLEPLKSFILILDPEQPGSLATPFEAKKKDTEPLAVDGAWKRSLTKALDYPAFGETKEVSLPDQLDKEEPIWSGIARYENIFTLDEAKSVFLEITDAAEGVEVFVNGTSLGIQVVPTYQYDLTPAVKPGVNTLVIEVATTLEREMSTVPNPLAAYIGGAKEPTNPSGLCGEVKLWAR